jgi:hypothetical protein
LVHLWSPTCGTMRWWGPYVGPCTGGAHMWDQALVGPCGTKCLFSFLKLFCDDNVVVLWCQFAFVMGSSRAELEWFIYDEIGSLFSDHLVSFDIILSGLAPSLVICDEVTKFVAIPTTSVMNKWNVTTKSSQILTFLLVEE